MVKNKRILKEIAKRFVKGVVKDSCDFAFMDSGLTEEEEQYVVDEVERIANRITDKEAARSTHDLVREYFEF